MWQMVDGVDFQTQRGVANRAVSRRVEPDMDGDLFNTGYEHNSHSLSGIYGAPAHSSAPRRYGCYPIYGSQYQVPPVPEFFPPDSTTPEFPADRPFFPFTSPIIPPATPGGRLGDPDWLPPDPVPAAPAVPGTPIPPTTPGRLGPDWLPPDPVPAAPAVPGTPIPPTTPGRLGPDWLPPDPVPAAPAAPATPGAPSSVTPPAVASATAPAGMTAEQARTLIASSPNGSIRYNGHEDFHGEGDLAWHHLARFSQQYVIGVTKTDGFAITRRSSGCRLQKSIEIINRGQERVFNPKQLNALTAAGMNDADISYLKSGRGDFPEGLVTKLKNTGNLSDAEILEMLNSKRGFTAEEVADLKDAKFADDQIQAFQNNRRFSLRFTGYAAWSLGNYDHVVTASDNTGSDGTTSEMTDDDFNALYYRNKPEFAKLSGVNGATFSPQQMREEADKQFASQREAINRAPNGGMAPAGPVPGAAPEIQFWQ